MKISNRSNTTAQPTTALLSPPAQISFPPSRQMAGAGTGVAGQDKKAELDAELRDPAAR